MLIKNFNVSAYKISKVVKKLTKKSESYFSENLHFVRVGKFRVLLLFLGMLLKTETKPNVKQI